MVQHPYKEPEQIIPRTLAKPQTVNLPVGQVPGTSNLRSADNSGVAEAGNILFSGVGLRFAGELGNPKWRKIPSIYRTLRFRITTTQLRLLPIMKLWPYPETLGACGLVILTLNLQVGSLLLQLGSNILPKMDSMMLWRIGNTGT